MAPEMAVVMVFATYLRAFFLLLLIQDITLDTLRDAYPLLATPSLMMAIIRLLELNNHIDPIVQAEIFGYLVLSNNSDLTLALPIPTYTIVGLFFLVNPPN